MILGHQNQWRFLKKGLEINCLSHAYLFFGQEKLGKKTLALDFIKLLNCQNKEFTKRPCQICRSCRDIQKEIQPDLILIAPKDKEIQIAQIKELNWKLSLRPYSAPYKTAIIDKAHLMNQEAQNCFLKTLEEPRGKVLLILISEHPEVLFSTILSRVQKIRFQPLSSEEIKIYFRKQGVEEKFADELSSFSLGRPGLAIDFFSDKEKFEIWKGKIKEFLKIVQAQKDINFRFQYLKKIMSFLNAPGEILDIWLGYFRELLLFKKGVLSSGIYKNFTQNFHSQADIYSFQKLKKILEVIDNTNSLLLTTNINPKLALEMVILEM